MKKAVNKNVCKTTRGERRKKFSKFKDTAHKCFGPAQSNGIGNPTPMKCSVCGETVLKARIQIYKSKVITVCPKCEFNPEICQLDEGRSMND